MTYVHDEAGVTSGTAGLVAAKTMSLSTGMTRALLPASRTTSSLQHLPRGRRGSRTEAIKHIADQLGVHPWVRQG